MGGAELSVIGRLLRRRDEPEPEPRPDPMSFLYRAKLVQLQMDRVADEAKRTTDPERARQLVDESALLLDNLRTIHEEQLAEMLK